MTLWTPGGEHPVGPKPAESPAADAVADLSPEDRARAEAMANDMAAVRQQLASVPAAMVVGNHAMGLYELAAIHLSAEPPKLEEARLAIDAMGAVVDGLGGRLGESEATLVDALGQLRIAFVQVKSSVDAGRG